MKKLFFILSLFLAGNALMAQSPVSWLFSSKKLGDKLYEVQLTATMQPGWHLYAQVQPKDAIAMPTSFQFSANPLLILEGAVKETGKLQKFKDEELDITANQYSNKVVFTQRVKLKTGAKTAVVGKLEYQTCDDKKCLPPKTVPFSITLK